MRDADSNEAGPWSGLDPNKHLPAEHDFPFLPQRFAERFREATGMSLTFDQLHQTDLAIGLVAQPRNEDFDAGRAHMPKADRVQSFRKVIADAEHKIAAVETIVAYVESSRNRETGNLTMPGARQDEPPHRLDGTRLAADLAVLRDHFQRVKDGYTGGVAHYQQGPNHKTERNDLWRALFICWAGPLAQEIDCRRYETADGDYHGAVIDFVLLASEKMLDAAELSRAKVHRFWSDPSTKDGILAAAASFRTV